MKYGLLLALAFARIAHAEPASPLFNVDEVPGYFVETKCNVLPLERVDLRSYRKKSTNLFSENPAQGVFITRDANSSPEHFGPSGDQMAVVQRTVLMMTGGLKDLLNDPGRLNLALSTLLKKPVSLSGKEVSELQQRCMLGSEWKKMKSKAKAGPESLPAESAE
ncbi:MAG: hypothetical protein AB7K68_12035 [Bacteriovoracia bacterium]